MNRGYPLEHEVEQLFMDLAGQSRKNGLLERTFRVPQSGSIRGLKGDIITKIPFLKKQFLIECKARKCMSKQGRVFRLDPDWLSKVEKEATELSMIPLLVFSFKGAKKDRLWCCIRETDYIELFGKDYDIIKNVMISKKKYILTRKGLSEYNKCGNFLVIKLEKLLQKLRQLKK